MVDLDYSEAVKLLYSLQMFGVKLGLDRVENFLGELGDPHRSFRSVHVAGTNGKGSTCVFLESMLRQSGKRIGLYTSPHIFDLTERIVADGRRIGSDYVARWVTENRERIERLSMTFFETTTAMAFSFFRDTGIELAVCEVGLGGRLDATNVLEPECAVITEIGIDHQDQLGVSKEEIATEKLGIVKHGVPVTTGERDPAVLAVFRESVEGGDSDLLILDEYADVAMTQARLDGSIFSYSSPVLEIHDLRLSQVGPHQVRNAALALMSLEVIEGWSDRPDDALETLESEAWIRAGLEGAFVPGRFHVVEVPEGTVVLDVAHNASAAEVLAHALHTVLPGRKAVAVIGMSADKDSAGILGALAPLVSEFIVSKPDFARHDRRTTAAELSGAAAKLHGCVSQAPSVSDAVRRGLGVIGADSYLLVAGSFYTVSEAFSFLKERNERF